ncbi:peptidoglycan/LPS O-acetylase OafA/YrhL [Pseudarthrobacter defluvii]|uniref:Peptidoglycan/LPS O-acetylase OafA/YrhL n=1 Tax=Pseudarthrobacter defluvii TaxID=410837 RepID=A0ABT9UD63_9MICC|nr:acyltransferase [Pseudarthrobacter defluvii]MDQ0117590.1 peptidoglycan/LPS O-acetylase OafA/YrhL [Pseudarthrobacter defluvii]
MSSRKAPAGLLVGRPLDPRNNSLNLIRLVLALAVLVHHSWPLTGAADEPIFAGETLGGWAVSGFFVISGYLITGSRFSHGLGDYLVHRIARIMPAFIVCLLTIVFFFAPIGYVIAKGSLDGYFGTATSPLNFLVSNMTLKMNHYDVAGTPLNVPYPGAWNGSLWSLYYEFVCYLVVAALGCFEIFRRSPWFLTLLFVASVVAQANIDVINRYTNGNVDVVLMFKLLPFFLGGAVLFAWKSRIGIHWAPAVVSLLVSLLMVSLFPAWGGQASGALIAYGTLWISTWLPQPGVISRNDVSYGVYIYAFAFQQLLAVFGAHEWGLVLFSLAATALTIPTAIASWVWIERPVMRRVRSKDRRSKTMPSTAPATVLPDPEAAVSAETVRTTL